MKLPLVGGSYTARSVAAAEQECINLIPESIEAGNEGKGKALLIGSPGKHLFKTMAQAGIYGLWSGGNRAFVVHGSGASRTLGEIDSTATVSSVGTFGTGTGPVQILSNGRQLLLIDTF